MYNRCVLICVPLYVCVGLGVVAGVLPSWPFGSPGHISPRTAMGDGLWGDRGVISTTHSVSRCGVCRPPCLTKTSQPIDLFIRQRCKGPRRFETWSLNPMDVSLGMGEAPQMAKWP